MVRVGVGPAIPSEKRWELGLRAGRGTGHSVSVMRPPHTVHSDSFFSALTCRLGPAPAHCPQLCRRPTGKQRSRDRNLGARAERAWG